MVYIIIMNEYNKKEKSREIPFFDVLGVRRDAR